MEQIIIERAKTFVNLENTVKEDDKCENEMRRKIEMALVVFSILNIILTRITSVVTQKRLLK